jgi:hypothetical protein
METVGGKVLYHVTTVTYTCGHSVDFKDSPPKKGEMVICRKCLKEVVVVSSKRETRYKYTKTDGSGFSGSTDAIQ